MACAALAAATAVALTACGGGAAEPAAPSGSHWVTVPRSHVVLSVPNSWEALDAAALDPSDQSGSDRLAEVARRTHVEMSDLRQQLRQLDLVLAGPAGSSSQVTLDMQGMDALPTDGEIYQQLAPVAVGRVDIRRFHSAVGDALTAAYDMSPETGGANVRLTALQVDEGVLLVVVSSPEATTSKSIEADTLGHIHRQA